MKSFKVWLLVKEAKEDELTVEVPDNVDNKKLEKKPDKKSDNKTEKEDNEEVEKEPDTKVEEISEAQNKASNLLLLFDKNFGLDGVSFDGDEIKKGIWNIKLSEDDTFTLGARVGKDLYKFLQSKNTKSDINWRGSVDFLSYYKENTADSQIGDMIIKIESDNKTGGIYTYTDDYATSEDAIKNNGSGLILIYGGSNKTSRFKEGLNKGNLNK